MNEESRILARLLKEKREILGYSLRKLSSVVGVSFSTLARVERGDGEPDTNTKVRILEWLGDDAYQAGLRFDSVALVHFRARKHIDSETVRRLLKVVDYLKEKYDLVPTYVESSQEVLEQDSDYALALTKDEMEEMAGSFRRELGLSDSDPLDPFRLKIEGVEILNLEQIENIDSHLQTYLLRTAGNKWDAMSVPLGEGTDRWVIIWNNHQSIRRQRVSLLEEIWHILLGHKLTRITRVAEMYGRTFAEIEEHDAYYLAAATLLPASSVKDSIGKTKDAAKVAEKFGTTSELVEYRIKRLGLWRQYKGTKVALQPED